MVWDRFGLFRIMAIAFLFYQILENTERILNNLSTQYRGMLVKTEPWCYASFLGETEAIDSFN